MYGKKGIIFSADIPNETLVLRTIESVSPYIDAIKIGNLVLYDLGWTIIKKIQNISGKPVIADLKLMEVPFMAEKICERACASGVDGIMICGSIGLDTMVICRSVFPKLLFVVTQFTHCRDVISDEEADRLVKMAKTVRCDGVQVPGTFPSRVKKVRSLVGNNMLIIACGVGRQGPNVSSAILAGADYEIVGRSIYEPTPNAGLDVTAAREAARRLRDMFAIV